ncbi:hypothetical protein AB0K34_40630, partial [Actinomadura sp. NPDC049382]|uniref:hypothetical protein n=1 Tax=Actinomadura sp. NPDC049382 TaxID=3158220 RepID=UPI00341BF9F1
ADLLAARRAGRADARHHADGLQHAQHAHPGDLIARGEAAAAERELRSYLDDAEAQLTKAYRAQG